MTVEMAMRRRILSVLIPMLALAMVVVIPAFPSGQAEARVGARMSSFALPAIPGGPTRGRFRLSEHLGENVIAVVFWATWCIPCRNELPLYQELYNEHHDDGLTVVAITMDGSSTLPQAASWSRRLGLRFPVVSDLDTSVTSRINPRRTAPFSLWIDHNGRIAREQEGFNLSERDAVVSGIEELLRARNADSD